jgi:hypothetical protein
VKVPITVVGRSVREWCMCVGGDPNLISFLDREESGASTHREFTALRRVKESLARLFLGG